MSERSVAWWEDVSREAESMFRVWTDGRELDWAKKSWDALSKRGLTSYSNQIEWTQVMVRLMALAAIYRDFCELAFDEIHEPEHLFWASELSLSTFRVAQCVTQQFRGDDGEDDEQLWDSALLELMEAARSEIHKVLSAEYGGDSLLFVSLWNTVDYWREEDLEPFEDQTDSADKEIREGNQSASKDVEHVTRIDWRENAGNVLNEDITGHKLAAFHWIQEGMTRVH